MRDTKFSINLKKLRKDYNLTQVELGKILNLTKSQISFYEKGASYPRIDLVTRLAQYFNVPLTQLIESSVRDYFYFREVVTGGEVHIENIPTTSGTENFLGIAGLIKNPIFLKNKKIAVNSNEHREYSNFMLLIPEKNSELTTFFYKHLNDLPIQSLEDIYNYNTWCFPKNTDQYYDGYPLLYQLLKSSHKGAWLNAPIAKPATDHNILALVLPECDEIIRFYILPEKKGCKLHAVRNPDLQKEIEEWLQKDPKERKKIGCSYCLSTNDEETAFEDMIDDNCTNTDEYDSKYNLKRFLKNRGIEMDED